MVNWTFVGLGMVLFLWGIDKIEFLTSKLMKRVVGVLYTLIGIITIVEGLLSS